MRKEILTPPCQIYRPYKSSDAPDIALHYNNNLKMPDNIWCAVGKEMSTLKVNLHRIIIARRGILLDQVHHDENGFLSYFIGYEKNKTATFSMGVVNLDTHDPMQILRRDTAVFIEKLLESGNERLIISGSSDKGRYVDWMEHEVKMQRDLHNNRWMADKDTLSLYVKNILLT